MKDDDGIEQALGHAGGALGQPKPLHQLVVTLFDNNTINLSYTCDEMEARAMLSKGEFILNLEAQQALADQVSRIAQPRNGDLKRFGL